MNFSKKNHEHKVVNLKSVSKKIILGVIFLVIALNIEAHETKENVVLNNSNVLNKTLNIMESNYKLTETSEGYKVALESCLSKAYNAANEIEENSNQDWSSEEWGRVFRNLFYLCNEFNEY
ncbi:hypothetical protein [Lutibacter sp.]|uniref:hypothetical protein n=1 Tax=Lutibacter sp. TaxID=1925666 RepID=UPI0035625C9B